MAIVWKEIGSDKIPCCMTYGNDGTTLNVNYPVSNLYSRDIQSSKATSASFKSYGKCYSSSRDLVNIDNEKLLDCDWIILVTAGGSTTSGNYTANYFPTTYSNHTSIDFESFCIGLKGDSTSSGTMYLYFTPKYKIIHRSTNTGSEGAYIMYYVKVDKDKSSIPESLIGQEIHDVYMQPALKVSVPTSSYIWYDIQAVPLISE